MSLIDDALALDAQLAFADADGVPGSESVSYTPFGGSARTVVVNVMRNMPHKVNGELRVLPIVVFIAKHATAGAASINRGGDTFGIADTPGGTAKTRVVNQIISVDGGGFLLELK